MLRRVLPLHPVREISSLSLLYSINRKQRTSINYTTANNGDCRTIPNGIRFVLSVSVSALFSLLADWNANFHVTHTQRERFRCRNRQPTTPLLLFLQHVSHFALTIFGHSKSMRRFLLLLLPFLIESFDLVLIFFTCAVGHLTPCSNR